MSETIDAAVAIPDGEKVYGERKGTVETMDGSMELITSSKHLMDSGKYTDDLEGGVKAVQPDMWSRDNIGLYCSYAAGGLLYGTAGTLSSFCVYVYHGQPNVCANASSLMFFAWSFKIIFAIITETIRPFGLRRKPWMIFGFCGVLLILAVLIGAGPSISASNWLASLLLMQVCYMVVDVPADGLSVQLGQLEPKETRGRILATGQIVRFSFSMFAGVIQTFMLNGRTTNPPKAEYGFDGVWSWGLTVSGYYGLIFALVFVLTLPILWMKEPDPALTPAVPLKQFLTEFWDTIQERSTLNLIIYAVGISCISNVYPIVNIYMQYYIIQLTNFQAGMDTITSYAFLTFAIWVFRNYLTNKNWRYTHYASAIFSNILGLLWLLVYYNYGGMRTPWFTIFIDLDQSFVTGITQVLYSMAIIEIAKKGQEATTYELLITVSNAAAAVSSILSTQLLTPLKVVGCSTAVAMDDSVGPQSAIYSGCPAGQVDIYDGSAGFDQSSGPKMYATYTIVVIIISISATLVFTQFLPKDKDQAQEWKNTPQSPWTLYRGIAAITLGLAVILYGFITAILLLNSNTSCLPFVGGSGC